MEIMRRRRRAGMSLVELSVGSVVLLIVLGAAYAVFTFSARYYERITIRSDMQRTAILTITRLRQALQETNGFSIEIPSSEALIFLAPRTLDNTFTTALDGGPLWSSVVCIRHDTSGETGRILRQQDAITPVPEAISPLGLVPPRDLTYFLNASTTSNRVVARHVSRFEVAKTGTVNNAVSIQFELHRTPERRDFRLEVNTLIQPKN
jgi:prepilin-type N-terminal cleavage/methylation domain-containing protein